LVQAVKTAATRVQNRRMAIAGLTCEGRFRISVAANSFAAATRTQNRPATIEGLTCEGRFRVFVAANSFAYV
jgi:hypothetical protein